MRPREIPGLRSLLFRGIARFYLGKPEQAGFLATRYVSARSIGTEGMNQLLFKTRSVRSFGLTSVQFEVTNRCNLKCTMCPVNRGMKRPRGDMDFDLFRKVVDENPGVEYFLLMNWGEPLLHPRLFDMVRYIRSKGGRPLFTTNGKLLTEPLMREMAGSGVERVTVSLDGAGATYERIRGIPYAEMEEKIRKCIEIRNRMDSPMAIDLNMVVFDETEDEVGRFLKQWEGAVDRVQIQPRIEFAGRRRTRCKEPWRGNAIILWDGTVVPCCVDYEGVMNLGNAKDRPLSEIFHGEAIRSLRALHNRGLFQGPCAGCSEYETPAVRPRFQ